mgnify:CR=1 FL=1
MALYPQRIGPDMVPWGNSLSAKDWRRDAAGEALKIGRGGVAYIARLFGCDPDTVRRGRDDMEHLPEDEAGDHVRKKGGPEAS